MSDLDDNKKKKKTLSLKLGSKIAISPSKSFESGQTVVVAKKRIKKNIATNEEINKKTTIENKNIPIIENNLIVENAITIKKSGVVLKPLSKDQQKELLHAKSKAEKNDAINKIRGVDEKKEIQSEIPSDISEKVIENKKNQTPNIEDIQNEANFKRRESDNEKKVPTPTFGRKKFRERKVTIVTALSGTDERTRSLAAYKRSKQKLRKNQDSIEPQSKIIRDVIIPDHITVKELAIRMSEKSGDVVKSLMKMGMMATINESLDADTAELLVTEFGHKFSRENMEDAEKLLLSSDNSAIRDKKRSPIVTVMGHVDHGKTSLLDFIRKSNVVSGESGGITQHIGAYQIDYNQNNITFIDTPGHAAFTDMRARGANVTDIVILIVAADDGVMPQTKEAISHAKSANVPIIVAINKCDKEDSNPQKIKEQLLSEEIVVEELSGEIQCVEVSAESGMNIDKLLEAIVLQADLLELKANYNSTAEGYVLEANIDKGRGPICNIIVTNGVLKIGDIAVAGTEMGKVRAMFDDNFSQMKEALPSTPIQVLGLGNVPEAGDSFIVVENEDKAKELCDLRGQIRQKKSQTKKVKFVDNEVAFGDLNQSKELVEVVLKADTRGSTEAIISQLEGIISEKVLIKVIHSGVGLINESDVALALASNALLIAFNTSATKEAKQKAKTNKQNINSFKIIYELIQHISDFATGKLKPILQENYLGKAEILQIFTVSKIGSIAGCTVMDGLVNKTAKAKVIRGEQTIFIGNISGLMREKNAANEVRAGTECGISIHDFQDYQKGDVLEIFQYEEISQTL